MPSDSLAAPSRPRLPANWPQWSTRVPPLLLFGVLPVAGLLAELPTGMLSSVLPLFPTWWHIGLVVAAVGMNLALHLGLWRRPAHVVARTVATGFVMGMALLYALAEAPAVPLMVVMAMVGLGVLAAAPYFACLGMLRLLPDLFRCWRAAGLPVGRLSLLLVAMAVLPTGFEAWSMHERHAERHELVRLGEAMRDPERAAEVERLAASLRRGDVAAQRAFCAFSAGNRRDERPGPLFLDDDFGPRRRHLANGRPFWFDSFFARREIDAAFARTAFHRVHGEGWNDGDHAIPEVDWRGGSENDWLSSRIDVRPEPDASLAQVDWQFEVTSHLRWFSEARFDLRLPPMAVASSLSSWIEGAERPAAFAANTAVQAAYDSVVAKKRDPALLQELSPGLLRLLLFPLSCELPPMRVRIGFTIPLRWCGDAAELYLPHLVEHNCRRGRPARHELVIAGTASPARSFVTDEELARPLLLSRGAVVTQAIDAQGVVVQRMVPRTKQPATGPFVIVLDASASVAKALPSPAAVLATFPSGADAVVFVAHGSELQSTRAPVGSPELARFLAGQSFTGGVDARPALQVALEEAAGLGVRTVYWLHGAAAALHPRSWPTFPPGVVIAAFALHPGRNVLREQWRAEPAVVDVARFGEGERSLDSLAEAVAHGSPGAAGDFGDHARVYERHATTLPQVTPVSDQIARLWAARSARELARTGQREQAAALAARYRVVAAGAGAVVLESKAQYDAAGLDPGALIGREPAGPAGSPTPELSTWLMVASGLVVILWCRRRRGAGASGDAGVKGAT